MMFDWLEKMPAPEGYKTEIVGGHIFMTPQRRVDWQIIRRILRALEGEFGVNTELLSDVRIDFPGAHNGFCPDVVKIRDEAETDARGLYRYQDIEFIAEVISQGTGMNDYGPKKDAYAEAGVPVYLLADPYTRWCIVHTHPKDGEYTSENRTRFGQPIDLTKTPVGMVISTDRFPTD